VSTRARVAALGGALVIALTATGGVLASSHREAPLIAGDPAADNTDLYAFVSPDDPNSVTIIANYIPLEEPAGGPNFHLFDDAVRYSIHVDNNGDAVDDVTYHFRFRTKQASGKNGVSSFLYNGGPLTTPTDADLLVRQTYSVIRVKNGQERGLGFEIPTVPANVGPRSTPDYATLAAKGVRAIGEGRKVYAGPRDDAFFVDLGSIFDLGGLRPFNGAHLIPKTTEAGVDGVAGFNTNTIALKIPKAELVKDAQHPTIGIWASASRRERRTIDSTGKVTWSGPWVQVSRLGNPLVNEVIIPRHLKDYWNGQHPKDDAQFEKYYLKPELAGLVNALYPALPDARTANRTDLSLILLQGVPTVNNTGAVRADLLRLNTSIPPCTADSATDNAGKCRALGVFPTDPAADADDYTPDLQAFPNGRRLGDDVTDIEIRAVADGYGPVLNALFGLPNLAPNNIVGDGVDRNADRPFLATFPYIGLPNGGYAHAHHDGMSPS
jgi:Domain of unknown function (DUF4331)